MTTAKETLGTGKERLVSSIFEFASDLSIYSILKYRFVNLAFYWERNSSKSGALEDLWAPKQVPFDQIEGRLESRTITMGGSLSGLGHREVPNLLSKHKSFTEAYQNRIDSWNEDSYVMFRGYDVSARLYSINKETGELLHWPIDGTSEIKMLNRDSHTLYPLYKSAWQNNKYWPGFQSRIRRYYDTAARTSDFMSELEKA